MIISNYDIHFYRHNPFYHQPTIFNTICTITFNDPITKQLVYTIQCTDLDLLKFIDNLYYSIANNTEIVFTFSNNSISGIFQGCTLYIDNPLILDSYQYHLSFFDSNSEEYIKRLTLDFQSLDSLEYFIDQLLNFIYSLDTVGITITNNNATFMSEELELLSTDNINLEDNNSSNL